MRNTNLEFQYDVRIPQVLLDQLMDGEITCAMYITMNILYGWADWNTGRVRWCSSGGLRTASRKAYSDRTFRVSLQRLEEMGWITRHMVPGSNEDYPVTIHNYKFVDDAGKVHILNPKPIETFSRFEQGECREDSHESSQEGSQESSQESSHETSQKVLPNLLLDTKSENESQLYSQAEGKKERRILARYAGCG